MKISKYISLIVLGFSFLTPMKAAVSMQELADSLTVYTGFNPLWSPSVRVKQLRVNSDKITVKTNATLRDVRWTPSKVAEIKRKVSRWVLDHEQGKVTILTSNILIDDLVTDCAKGIMVNGKQKDT